ncbi:MAG: hypothetical protein WC584_03225 [Candidatus Pacearchaeota archaeon]
MIRYHVDNIRINNQRVELDLLMDSVPTSLSLNSLSGGMKGETLETVRKGDSLWIDLGEDREEIKEDNAHKIKRIYLQRSCYENLISLLYER